MSYKDALAILKMERKGQAQICTDKPLAAAMRNLTDQHEIEVFLAAYWQHFMGYHTLPEFNSEGLPSGHFFNPEVFLNGWLELHHSGRNASTTKKTWRNAYRAAIVQNAPAEIPESNWSPLLRMVLQLIQDEMDNPGKIGVGIRSLVVALKSTIDPEDIITFSQKYWKQHDQAHRGSAYFVLKSEALLAYTLENLWMFLPTANQAEQKILLSQWDMGFALAVKRGYDSDDND